MTSQLLSRFAAVLMISSLMVASLMALGCSGDDDLSSDTGVVGDTGGADTAMTPDAPRNPGDEFGNGVALDDSDSDPSGEGDNLSGSEPRSRNTASCFDGIDNNLDGLSDCEAPSCASLAACCAGRRDCCSAEGREDLPRDLDLTTCSDASCFPVAEPFGDPLPSFAEGFAPSGELTPSGVVLGEAIDLRTRRVTVEVDFALPDCTECLESISVELNADEVQDPLVSVTLIAATRMVVISAAGETVGGVPLGSLSGSMVLSTFGTGEFNVTLDGVDIKMGRFAPAPARVALSGFNRNPDLALPSAKFTRIGTDVSLCDVPRAWSSPARPEVFVVRTTTALEVNEPLDPTLAVAPDGTRWFAFVQGNGIHLGRENEDGSRLLLFDTLDAPAINAEGGARLRHPELVFDGDVPVLYYSLIDASGTSQVMRAMRADASLTFTSEVALPEGRDASVVLHPDGVWVMIARVSGEPRVFLSSDGKSFEYHGRTSLRAGLPASARGYSLAIHGTSYRLHYDVQAGSRRAIHAAISDDLVGWRMLGEVLAPRSVAGEVEVFGADVISVGARLDMVLLSSNGSSTRLAFSNRDVNAH